MAKKTREDCVVNPCPSVEDLNNLPMSTGLVVVDFRGVPDGAIIIRTIGGWIYNFNQSSAFVPDPLQADPVVPSSPTKKIPKAPPNSSRPKG